MARAPTVDAGADERLPMVGVLWAGAYAFYILGGAFLPTDAEYAYASAGGADQWEYPWGAAGPRTASMYAIYGCDYPFDAGGACDPTGGSESFAPVGIATAGAGRWGQLDLAGEALEWNLDVANPSTEPCNDCVSTATSTPRVIRGGSANHAKSWLAVTSPSIGAPTLRSYLFGFRCARTSWRAFADGLAGSVEFESIANVFATVPNYDAATAEPFASFAGACFARWSSSAARS